MENNIQIQKPTFTSKQDKLLQIAQYYIAIQNTQNLSQEDNSKIIDEEFESNFLRMIPEENLERLWNIYENSVGIADIENIDIDLTSFYNEQIVFHKSELDKYQSMLQNGSEI